MGVIQTGGIVIEEVPETALTILHKISREGLARRVRGHREDFEESIRRQGSYMPSEIEMSRWFKEPPTT